MLSPAALPELDLEDLRFEVFRVAQNEAAPPFTFQPRLVAEQHPLSTHSGDCMGENPAALPKVGAGLSSTSGALISAALVMPSAVAEAEHPMVLQKLSAWNAAAPAPASEITTDQVSKAAAAVHKREGGRSTTLPMILKREYPGRLCMTGGRTGPPPACGATCTPLPTPA